MRWNVCGCVGSVAVVCGLVWLVFHSKYSQVNMQQVALAYGIHPKNQSLKIEVREYL